MEFGEINGPIFPQDTFVDACVDNLANDIAVLGHLKKFTFQCHRKFVNQRRIHKFALAYMESGFFQLMGFRIESHILHPDTKIFLLP